MLAYDISMYMLRVDSQMKTEKGAEPGRIEHGAGPQDPGSGNAVIGCIIACHAGHYVQGVGGYHQYGVGRILRIAVILQEYRLASH